jgi:SynChlorMet cassette radical SAM/SPASM protein ScmE
MTPSPAEHSDNAADRRRAKVSAPTAVMRSPRSVDIDITAACNARCLYCYHFDDDVDRGPDDLPTSEWLRFFDELGRLGVMDVTLAGGEPFLRADLGDLIDGIVSNRMRFTILSNGALLTDEMAAFLAATGRCDGVQISVDGSRAEVHDAARGAGSFEGAMRALDILRLHQVSAQVRVTVHRHNVDDLEAIAELLLVELDLPGFGTNSAGYLGSCRVHADELMLTIGERERAMKTLVTLERRYPGRVQAMAGPLADARLWARMEEARRSDAAPFPEGGRLTGCGCPWERLAVRADGAILICPMLPDIVLGHVNVDSIERVWLDHPALATHRERSDIALASLPECDGCDYRPYCTGNCPGLAYALTGSVDRPSPDACLRDYLSAGGALIPYSS